MIQTHPVVIRRPDGAGLAGIYSAPESGAARDVAVLLLSPGVKMRVAPHRQYRRLAEELNSAGWPVLRFDFFGLGDSEGELTEKTHSELYTRIQKGLYVDDVLAAMGWLEEQGIGERGFVLAGLCGGAITGLLTAARDRRVKGLISFGIPVMLDQRDTDPRTFISTGQLNKLRSGYLRRLKDPDAWLRLLSLKTDYRLLARSVFRRSAKAARAQDKTANPDNCNELFAPAFLALLARGIPIHCIFGGSDRLYWEFEEQFLARHRKDVGRYEGLFSLNIIPDANHIFAWREWEQRMFSLTLAWLEQLHSSGKEHDRDVAA